MKCIHIGISGNCVHLHLPGDLHKMINEIGISKTQDTVNLYLLDAIDKIKSLKDTGFYKFEDIDNIYMLSPALIGRALKFLEDLDFKVNSYKKKDLKDDNFIANTPEAQLATSIFGRDKNIGSAIISFEKLNSEEWQKKKNNKIKEFNENGILINDKEKAENHR